MVAEEEKNNKILTN